MNSFGICNFTLINNILVPVRFWKLFINIYCLIMMAMGDDLNKLELSNIGIIIIEIINEFGNNIERHYCASSSSFLFFFYFFAELKGCLHFSSNVSTSSNSEIFIRTKNFY